MRHERRDKNGLGSQFHETHIPENSSWLGTMLNNNKARNDKCWQTDNLFS